MSDDDVLHGRLESEVWLTLEQVATVCCVESEWLMAHVNDGLFPQVVNTEGDWRFPWAVLLRVRRVRQIERDFESHPELAALVADMLEEIDSLRRRLRYLEPTHRG